MADKLSKTAQPATKKPAAKKPAAKKPAAATSRAAAVAAAAASATRSDPKERLAHAVDEAQARASAAGKVITEKAGEFKEKFSADAKVYGEQAREKAGELAEDGKARASDAIAGLGKVVAESSSMIDEKLGSKYGDYARTAARSLEETAAKLEAKDVAELGEDAREFVRKSPGVAIGAAAVAGFILARLFRGSRND